MSVRSDIAAFRHLPRPLPSRRSDIAPASKMSGTVAHKAMPASLSDGLGSLAIRLGNSRYSSRRFVPRMTEIRSLRAGFGMRDETPSVLIIDDDSEFRDSVARLLRTVGLHTREFSSVSDFLQADPWDGPTCLVLDVRMPGRSGLELQRDLAAAKRQVPIIFITAHADVPMTVQAMKGGA